MFMRATCISLARAEAFKVLWGVAVLCGLLLGHTATVTAQDRWDDPVKIKRQPSQPNRKPAPRQVKRTVATVQRAPLLTVQWRLLKFTDDGLRRVVSVDETFTPQDRLLLAVKANQNGYLYIIRQPAADRDGQLLFPSRHYNSGRNYVRTDQEFVLPSDCADFAVPCWFTLPPPAGKEIVTLIFSRDEIEELPNFVAPSAVVPNVKAPVITQLLAGTQQRLQRIPGVLRDRYTIWVRNTNAENNEEIIETLTLNKTGSGNRASVNAPGQ
jgi:hypothetical protein